MKLMKSNYLQSSMIKNGLWGVVANVLQILFVCLFFVIVARKYNTTEFGGFLISNTVYQVVAAFSSMGLGQWFIRQYALEDDKTTFTGKFIKTQIGLGLLFYLVNIVLSFFLYQSGQIRLLCFILGTNIIFDNFINALRTLNIAEAKQYKTASVLVIDGLLKLLVGCLLFIHPLSVVMLSVMMIVVRLLTVSLFLKLGSPIQISLKLLWLAKTSYQDIKDLIIKNWQFMVIGSISIIYWRIGNIIISKMLTLSSVADYEIAFRVFSVLQILPVVASATVYPQFIKLFNENNYSGLKDLYKKIFIGYTIFAILCYAFIYSFSPVIIPFAFGKHYPGSVACLQQMFLTYLLLPTVLLQANLIVAIGLEKLDMWFNIVSLLINVLGCFAGFYFVKDLSVVNLSVFASFIVFHILQDVYLTRKKIIEIKHCILFYGAIALTIFCCSHFTEILGSLVFFSGFAVILGLLSLIVLFILKKEAVVYIKSSA